MYAYDGDAIAQASTLDPYRVASSLQFAHTHDDDGLMREASTLTLDGPRGAERFARMWAYWQHHGIMPDALDDALHIVIGARGQTGIGSPAGQRQMLAIMRWLLACAGHGEDVLAAAMLAAYESAGKAPTVGEIMAHTPDVIETLEWARREPPRSSTPIEWLE